MCVYSHDDRKHVQHRQGHKAFGSHIGIIKKQHISLQMLTENKLIVRMRL